MIKKIIGIMASTEQGVVGNKGILPWNYPGELQHFKDTVKGHVIVMGNKTFPSLSDDLISHCSVIIFSRQASKNLKNNYSLVSSLSDFLNLMHLYHDEKIFVIGGAQIAHLFLEHNLISEFILTKIKNSYIGDTYLDLTFFNGWKQDVIQTHVNYDIMLLTNPLM